MTAMATDGNEVGLGIRFLIDRLKTDTGAGGLRNPTTPLVTGIHEGRAPQGSGLPYVEVAFLSGDAVAADVGANEVMAELRYQVKAIGAGVDVSALVPIVRRIFARLQHASASYPGGTSTGTILWCVRGPLVSYIEGTAEPIRHHGHEWRLLCQAAVI